MKMKKKTGRILLIAVIVVGLIVVWAVVKNGQKAKVFYKTEAAKKGDVQALVSTTGTVNPIQEIQIGSQVSGKIVKLNVDFNSPVKAGDVVAEIDQSQLKTQVQQSEASYNNNMASLDTSRIALDSYTKKYERAKALFAKEMISQEDMDTAETNYLSGKKDVVANEAKVAQAKSTLDQAKVNLSYAIIKSPVDGVVISRDVELGQTLAAGYTVPVVYHVGTDLTKMKVECSVDEADIGRVKEGQKVNFTVESYSDETFNGVIQQVRYSPTTTSNVVTYTVEVYVDNPDLKLRPGMTATVSIIVGEAKNALLIPSLALRFTPTLSDKEMKKIFADMRKNMGGQRPQGSQGSGPGMPPAGDQGAQRRQMSRVWILKADGSIMPALVKTGVTDGSHSEIIGGNIKEGDLIITGTSTTATTTTNNAQRNGPPGPPMMFR